MEDDLPVIRVNFGRAIPLFPLDRVVLLPQQVMPLHIFEPRYVQMIERALDGSGQIAMAVFEGDRWTQEYHGNPPIRPAVCIGQIIQHEPVPGDRYNIALQGVCRARVLEEEAPEGDSRLYREAFLEPTEGELDNEDANERLRSWIVDRIDDGPLNQVVAAEQIIDHVRSEALPTQVALELVAHVMLTEPETRYRLLEEGDPDERRRMIRAGLEDLGELIERARAQGSDGWPKGVSWN